MEEKAIKILYLDDEETNLFIFKELLKSKYQIITSGLPLDALSILDNQAIDIVISDMKMPQMNGVEFVKKASQKHQNIPYFILTAFENNDEINQAVEQQLVRHCFIKPLNVDHISSEITKVFEK